MLFVVWQGRARAHSHPAGRSVTGIKGRSQMSRCHFTVVPGFACSDSQRWQKKTGWGDLELNVFSTLFKKEVEKKRDKLCLCVFWKPGGTGRHISAYLNEHWPTWNCFSTRPSLLGVSVGVCLMSPRLWHGLRVCSLFRNARLTVSAGPFVTPLLQLNGSVELVDWQLDRM